MRISESITELERIKAEQGDLPIVVEGMMGYFEADSVEVIDIDRYSFMDAPRGVEIS